MCLTSMERHDGIFTKINILTVFMILLKLPAYSKRILKIQMNALPPGVAAEQSSTGEQKQLTQTRQRKHR